MNNPSPELTPLPSPETPPKAHSAQPPLTEEQIRKMNGARYPRALSPEEIKYINDARSSGVHLGY